jgi:hypothetical protein
MGRERAEEQRTQTEKKTLICQEENRKARKKFEILHQKRKPKIVEAEHAYGCVTCVVYIGKTAKLLNR